MNDYCVYLHRNLNGVVFYVGKGKHSRAFSKSKRNKQWEEMSTKGYSVEIYKDNLSESESFELELSLINNPELDWKLTNIRKTNVFKDVFLYDLSRYFYDETSPSCLSRKLKNGKIVAAGTVTNRYAYDEPQGWYVHVKPGHKLAVHRIVMMLHGFNVTVDKVVNHINCNPLDNKIRNLELCTQRENNQRNKCSLLLSLNPKNKSGITGVLEIQTKNKSNIYFYAAATWSENGRTRMKKFSYNKYGKELAWELAIKYRNLMSKQFYEDVK